MFHQTWCTDIRLTRDYKFDDLAGTCGGYIDLLLVYALKQFSGLIEVLLRTIKGKLAPENIQS